MSKKRRDFVLVSHCLLNPHCRVHILGKNFTLPKQITSYLLSRNVAIIQLPCPEFLAMGYWRNPQGRQQYDNVFFKEHCKNKLDETFHVIEELIRNNHNLLAYIGVQGSPTCSVYWGKHKTNKYNTESMVPVEIDENNYYLLGIMTQILYEKLQELHLKIPLLEAPIKESIHSDKYEYFFNKLKNIVEYPMLTTH